MIFTPLNIIEELENVQRTYSLNREDVLSVLRKALCDKTNRNIFVVEGDDKTIKIQRHNKDGSLGELSTKYFRSNIKTLSQELSDMSFKKRCERIRQIFKKRSLIEGSIIDKTPNGYFVVCKGERTFLPIKNCYQSEKSKGMYENGVKLSFDVDRIYEDKVYLTRKSLTLFKYMVLNLIHRPLNIKLISKGLLVSCDKPFLDESQMNMIRLSIPEPVIFKKIKEQ